MGLKILFLFLYANSVLNTIPNQTDKVKRESTNDSNEENLQNSQEESIEK